MKILMISAIYEFQMKKKKNGRLNEVIFCRKIMKEINEGELIMPN